MVEGKETVEKCGSDDQIVRIPKEMSEYIQKQEWFQHYRDIEDFVLEALRRRIESLSGSVRHL